MFANSVVYNFNVYYNKRACCVTLSFVKSRSRLRPFLKLKFTFTVFV